MQKSAINRQRGSVIVSVVVSLLVGLVLLGGVQLGYYFHIKRELQNTADLAVLSGVQLLQDGASVADGCDKAIVAARANAKQNFNALAGYTDEQLPISCGTWSAVHAAPKHFVAEVDAGDGTYNALHLTIAYNALPFLPFSSASTITVEAIAKKSFQPMAAFSVGASLLELDEGALTNTLSVVGLNLFGTSLGSFKGLVDAKIKTSGLLENILGEDALDGVVTVGDLNTLLATEVGLGQIMVAAVKAADAEEIIGATLLQNIGVQLDSLTIPLGSVDENGRGSLFTHIVAPSAQAALNTMVGVGDILNVVLGVATKNRAVDLPLDVDVLGLLKVEAKVGVIEPPSIGIGGPGATAYSASVRAFLRLCVDLGMSCGEATGGFLSGLLELKVDIPVGIEVVTGKATLGPMCERKDASGNPIAEITSNSTVLGLCIGNITEANVFSTAFSCVAPKPAPKNIATLKALGINLLNLNSRAGVPALSTTGTADYIEGDVKHQGNDLALGDTVEDLLTELFGSGVTDNSGWDANNDDMVAAAQAIWNRSKAKPEFSHCTNINAETLTGYNCRNNIREDALESIKEDFDALPGNSGLIVGLLNGLGDLLGGLLGLLLGGGDECAKKGALGLSYGGSEQGCINKVGTYLAEVQEAANPPGSGLGLSPLLALVVDILTASLTAPLNSLGDVLSELLESLGLNVNGVRVELISLDCNDAAQLVY